MSAAELAKQHGPGVAIGALALAVALAGGGSTTEVVRVAQTQQAAQQAAPRPSLPIVSVSLVSCGEMRGTDGAKVTGDSRAGTIKVGPNAGGRCTLVFDRLVDDISCSVDGAKSAELRGTDLVIGGTAPVVSYRCAPARKDR